jgi:beta-lactamase regulating signal transducer with metallopeptidase domain
MNAVSDFARRWLDWSMAATWQLALLVAIVAALTLLLRNASPRLRYGLWTLVLLKALLPPSLTAFWGVGAWGVAPVTELADISAPGELATAETPADSTATADSAAAAMSSVSSTEQTTVSDLPSLPTALLFTWAAGCLALWLAVAWRYRRLQRRIRTLRLIDEGSARIEMERLAQRLDLRTTPELYATDEAASPMLVGVLAPKIILPEQLLGRLSRDELAMILAHELIHWRRRDTWVGWLQVFVQGVFWFHPLVWWANARIRHERECACDETVLREARCDRDGYGETILRTLTAARGRSLAMGSMVGVFERGSRLQLRLEEIMSFDPTKRRFGWLSRVALVAAALALLPMAAPSVQAGGDEEPGKQLAASSDDGDVAKAKEKDKGKDKQKNKQKRPKTNWPTIVKTNPKIGATGVDPGLEEISVTFDRDMDTGGYSWTGGGEHFPQSPEGAGAVWVDKRTCVLPVRLERGKFYRVGINSTSFQNFRSELGVPTPTAAIFFTTEGAPKSLERQVRIPKVVKMTPDNGDADVDPGLKVIRVEFDMPMSTDGYSFTGGGPAFPTIPEGKRPRWSRDGKTVTLPVELKPDTQYELGLNSVSHKNFASRWGVPLEPVAYKFHTSPGKE